MNILRLDLVAFGPFERQSLLFEQPQPGLHLVFGNNEAGKSSCRRAIGQWLFGIPHKSTDNFRHPSAKLRIGGQLRNGLGQTLEFLRKKGRKDTLRSIDDAVTLAPESLAPFLGGVDAVTFSQRFSLDHQELIAGGQSLGLGSELGEVLFAAGAGIADIRAIQNSLHNRARELFLSGGSNPKINELLRQVSEAKVTQRNRMLSAANWAEIELQLQQAQERNCLLDQQLLGLRRELRQLERWQRAIPQVARWRACQAMLENLPLAPRLPEDISQRRVRATTNLSAAMRANQEVEQRIANLTNKLQAVEVSHELLKVKTLIRSLHTRLGSIQKAAQDRTRLVAELRVAESQFAECQRDWEDFAGDPGASDVQIGARVRSQLQSLATAYVSVMERHSLCEATVVRLERELEKVRPNLTSPASTTVAPIEQWQVTSRSLAKFADLEQQAQMELQQLAEDSARLTAMLDSLPLGPHTSESLVGLALPLVETVERFLQEWTENEQGIEGARAHLNRARQNRHDVERELNVMRHTEQVPTEAELTAARDARNRAWDSLLNVHPPTHTASQESLETSDDSSSISESDAAESREQFWDLTLAADVIADRLRREAGRVAQLAQLLVDLESAQLELCRCEESLETVIRQQEVWWDAWVKLWRPCQVTPLTPREMISWLRRCQEVQQAIHANRQLRSRCADREQQIANARETASQLLHQMGLGDPLPSESLTNVLLRAEQQLQILRRDEQQREQRRQREIDLQLSLAEARVALEAAFDSRLDWQQQWTEVLSTARLNPVLGAHDLPMMFEKFDRWQSLTKELAKHRQRIAGIDRDQAAFDGEVAPLQIIEPVAANLRSEEVVALLYDRLTRTEQELARQEQWQAQLEAEHEERQKQVQAMAQWEQELHHLCELANCKSVDELAIVEQDSLQRMQVERELGEVQRQLLELAESEELSSFVRQVEQGDADNVAWQMERLHGEITATEAQRSVNSETVGRLKRELENLDGNSAAAQAQEEVVQGLAAIQHHAQHYIHLRLAAGILGRVMDRYRQANQGGVLARAGALFSELTLGSFAGVQVEVQENGGMQVMGIRPDKGTMVPTTGMSEGSCDQLYLAFRIALLEAYLERNAPVPLLVDDLLITFDDRRSVAALRVLAALGRQTQVIFFTHHQRLVELAQQHLAPESYSVQTLESH